MIYSLAYQYQVVYNGGLIQIGLIIINFILAVQEERGPRKTTRLRKLISNYSEIGNQKLNKKHDTDNKEVDVAKGL